MSSTAITSRASQPVYYHREYKNDIPNVKSEESQEHSLADQCKRVAFVALPFISLYKPLSFPISLAMGGLRTVTCVQQLIESIKSGNSKEIPYAMLQTAIAVIALAGTIFAHPLGMLISTGHDLIIEVAHLIEHLKKGEYQKAIEDCLGIINNALYLALFLHGGLEIGIASLVMQILIGLYHSQAEFRKGHYIEGVGHLLMSMTRGNQLAGQVKILQFRNQFHKNVQTHLSKVDTSQVDKSSRFYETYRVSVINYGGFNFHVADYNDGARIVTCLDGGMRGYQAIAYNGSQVASSYDVQWYSNYFVHRYPDGKVYSYSNRQIAEVY
jgi:hypothetical protein